ncbi:Ubiquinone/menaquinone biosynthesis C-methyltransferase UbiE [Arthrobacter sp. Bi26]|uniref:class I SAM-dependent methyltransferase n=1 Tax=Arthrobacter sp. Bi26 TaxID=2822350 RepID=UPI001D6E7361|nr:class I SAM-dependent methyltransferase [Arthrobacter sp. Bi26]CAH0201427.1 Ubiquinone/menaquinone biosynthesis C-methyltransferase UbiE [Arthrobacter sp. Bi26]
MSMGDMALPEWKHSRPGGTGYPTDAEAWNVWYTENDRGWAPASSSVRAMLNGLAPGRALDLGAGDGRNAVWLAGRGWHVTAMDFSAAALDIGRGRAFAEGVTDLITWSVADVTTCAPVRGSLDLVLAAFLHLPGPDREGTIARTALGLAPGGLFLYIGHDPADPRENASGPRSAAALHHSARVAGWARRAGLQVETAETRSRPVPGARRPALDCVVLARSPAAPAQSPPTAS